MHGSFQKDEQEVMRMTSVLSYSYGTLDLLPLIIHGHCLSGTVYVSQYPLLLFPSLPPQNTVWSVHVFLFLKIFQHSSFILMPMTNMSTVTGKLAWGSTNLPSPQPHCWPLSPWSSHTGLPGPKTPSAPLCPRAFTFLPPTAQSILLTSPDLPEWSSNTNFSRELPWVPLNTTLHIFDALFVTVDNDGM